MKVLDCEALILIVLFLKNPSEIGVFVVDEMNSFPLHNHF
jgi:hypothetical protein